MKRATAKDPECFKGCSKTSNSGGCHFSIRSCMTGKVFASCRCKCHQELSKLSAWDYEQYKLEHNILEFGYVACGKIGPNYQKPNVMGFCRDAKGHPGDCSFV